MPASSAAPATNIVVRKFALMFPPLRDGVPLRRTAHRCRFRQTAGWDVTSWQRRSHVRITKYSHSCLRVEADGVLVVDPGVFSERSALDGADAVLVTHEHPD